MKKVLFSSFILFSLIILGGCENSNLLESSGNENSLETGNIISGEVSSGENTTTTGIEVKTQTGIQTEIEDTENTKDSDDKDMELKALNTPENTTMILSGDFWHYTNKKFGFNLKLPKKYWSDPRILYKHSYDKDYIYFYILLPDYDKDFVNNDIPTESVVPKRYLEILIIAMLPKETYNKFIETGGFFGGMVGGGEALKEITIGKNNEYYFTRASSNMSDSLLKLISPALECKERVEKYKFNGEKRESINVFCDRRVMFPKGSLQPFDI